MSHPPQPGPSSYHQVSSSATIHVTDLPRPVKRARIAVACQRCKTRKQKCDGAQPKCGNCKNLPTPCEYIVPSKTIPYGKYQYMKALESRVAELELIIANAGLTDRNKQHWDSVVHKETLGEVPPATGSNEQQAPQHPSPYPAHSEASSNFGTPTSTTKQSQEEPRILEATQYLKDLSLQAGGQYVGDESSNITIGNMFQSLITGGGDSENDNLESLTPKASLTAQADSEPCLNLNPLLSLSPDIADTLLKGYLKHISTRWVAVFRPHIIHLHQMRESLEDPFEISTLNLVYAIGGRFLETTGETGEFYPARHYQVAMSYLDTILQFHDVRSAQTLLLHAVYCLRAPRALSAWTHIGLAIRICIGLGMHRRDGTEQRSLAEEIRKRVFWSCYCLDRQVSIILGRPFAISDRDIDIELPLDVDDGLGDMAIQSFTNTKPNEQASPSTSLSCFIHVIRLRRIESEIQQSIYRVDKQDLNPSATINQCISLLEYWKERIPADFVHQDTEYYSYDGRLYYEIYYYQCLRLLLYPHVTGPNSSTDIIIKCAEACGGLCRSYKSLHSQTSVGYSLMALYSIFLAGLTLLYCIWLSPQEIYSISRSNDLNSCSIVLYIIAERWPGAKKYRDAFETLKQSVLSMIEGGFNARVPIRSLGQEKTVNAILQGERGLHHKGKAELGRMMSDLTGASPIQPPMETIIRGYTETGTQFQQSQPMQQQYTLSTPNAIAMSQQYLPPATHEPPYGPVIRNTHLANHEQSAIQNTDGMQASGNRGFAVREQLGGEQRAPDMNDKFLDDFDLGAFLTDGFFGDEMP